MREIVLQTHGLCKRYRKFTALDNVDMTVCRGDIYGLIGRNGAGKTTLMKLVTGLCEPTSGEFELFSKKGREAQGEKYRIGCLIENPAFFPNLTAHQNLRYYCLQKGIAEQQKADEALQTVGLAEVRNKRFKSLSLGMKQRLGIAFALLDDPDLIILDEPINGLDPIGISELRETFRRLNRERGITFVISSHILSELYAVAGRFLFIEKGRVLREMTKQQLDLECSRCLVVKAADIKRAATVLEEALKLENYKITDEQELRIYDREAAIDTVSKTLVQNSVGILGIYESGVSIEDYFKQLVGEVQS